MIRPYSRSEHILATTFLLGVSSLTMIGAEANLATGLPSWQSSTVDENYSKLAVDGDKSSKSCTLTKAEPLTWWFIDLLKPYTITSVEITNCYNNWASLANFSVEVFTDFKPKNLDNLPDSSKTVCVSQTEAIAMSATYFYHCHRPLRGRYIRVVKYNLVPELQPLSMCEFETYTPQLWLLEKEPRSSGHPVYLETLPGKPTATECAQWCVHRSGPRCKHILMERATGICHLLKYLKRDGTDLTSDFDIYTVNRY